MPHDESWFDQLAQLLELERREERARSAEERRTLPLTELQARGQVLLDLEAVEEDVGLGGRFLITFERPDRRALPARFSPGDLVEVRPRKAEIETPARAVVSRAGATRLQLAFDRSPPEYVREGRTRIDRIPNDVTFDRAREGLRRLQALDKGRERRRRDVLLGREPARFSSPLPALTPTRPLNPEQLEAATRALAAEDFFLVHGPPGTGKSTVLAEVAAQAVAGGARLLCTAASNAAVDHLLDLCVRQGLRAIRIGHPARVSDRLQAHVLDIVVESHPDRVLSRELFDEAFDLLGYARRQRTRGRSRERFANARASKAEANALFDEARALERRAVRAVLEGAQVICATLSMLDGGLLSGETFDLALVDEATQAIEPLALLAFLRAPKVILAGDHRQLPPTVLSEEAAARGLARSLFERLLDEHGDGVKQMLREQYRMNERIMSFPSRELYGGELRAHASVATRALGELLTREVDAPPVLFIDTAGKGFEEQALEGDQSLFNEGEAALVIARAQELTSSGLPPEELAIITPYRAQAALIRERLGDALAAVEVDTVDAFQGREKEAVLVSLVRTNTDGQIGFLTDLRRINVAITRAKRHLFVVGDSATLGGHAFYARFIEEAQQHGGYRSAWDWPEPAPVTAGS
ncbi:MAG: AAA family ATPase [Myxococcaceae bacterium]|nr:AAA family ATPase [Myxococcaceae bacterium]